MEGVGAVSLMATLMGRGSLDIPLVLQLVETLNRSYFQCQRIVCIMQQVFSREKSGKILLAVQVLEYLVKNCNKNWHQAANKESFQSKLLTLLKRLRGKSSFLKDLRSNSDNWNRIEAKVLYLVQLWYDAFILEEAVYDNIIATYKLLRKENVLFPPRSANEKNLLAVQTQSPILENIEEIARHDHQKFAKQLGSMGMSKAAKKMEMAETEVQQKRLVRQIDVDELGQRIAIVRSNGYEGVEMLKLVEEIKKDLEFGKVNSSEEKYWIDLKAAGESVIQEWEEKNAELIQQHEKAYLDSKMHKREKEEPKPDHREREAHKQILKQTVDLLADLKIEKERESEEGGFGQFQAETKKKEEINLLDL